MRRGKKNEMSNRERTAAAAVAVAAAATETAEETTAGGRRERRTRGVRRMLRPCVTNTCSRGAGRNRFLGVVLSRRSRDSVTTNININIYVCVSIIKSTYTRVLRLWSRQCGYGRVRAEPAEDDFGGGE